MGYSFHLKKTFEGQLGYQKDYSNQGRNKYKLRGVQQSIKYFKRLLGEAVYFVAPLNMFKPVKRVHGTMLKPVPGIPGVPPVYLLPCSGHESLQFDFQNRIIRL